jgi:hypothetical protein
MQNEISFDDFHEKKDRIYEAWNRAAFSGEVHCWNTTPVRRSLCEASKTEEAVGYTASSFITKEIIRDPLPKSSR